MHEEMHGCGRVVPSLMVMENGAIGFARTIFRFRWYHCGEHGAWTWAAALADIGWYSYGNGEQGSESGWLVWECGLSNGLFWVGFGRCSWLDVFYDYDVGWTCRPWFIHWGGHLNPNLQMQWHSNTTIHCHCIIGISITWAFEVNYLIGKPGCPSILIGKPGCPSIFLLIQDWYLAWALTSINAGVYMILYLFDIKKYL